MCFRGPNCLVVGLRDITNSVAIFYNNVWYRVRVTLNMIWILTKWFVIPLWISTFGCNYTTCSIILKCASWLVFLNYATYFILSCSTWWKVIQWYYNKELVWWSGGTFDTLGVLVKESYTSCTLDLTCFTKIHKMRGALNIVTHEGLRCASAVLLGVRGFFAVGHFAVKKNIRLD